MIATLSTLAANEQSLVSMTVMGVVMLRACHVVVLTISRN